MEKEYAAKLAAVVNAVPSDAAAASPSFDSAWKVCTQPPPLLFYIPVYHVEMGAGCLPKRRSQKAPSGSDRTISISISPSLSLCLAFSLSNGAFPKRKSECLLRPGCVTSPALSGKQSPKVATVVSPHAVPCPVYHLSLTARKCRYILLQCGRGVGVGFAPFLQGGGGRSGAPPPLGLWKENDPWLLYLLCRAAIF